MLKDNKILNLNSQNTMCINFKTVNKKDSYQIFFRVFERKKGNIRFDEPIIVKSICRYYKINGIIA